MYCIHLDAIYYNTVNSNVDTYACINKIFCVNILYQRLVISDIACTVHTNYYICFILLMCNLFFPPVINCRIAFCLLFCTCSLWFIWKCVCSGWHFKCSVVYLVLFTFIYLFIILFIQKERVAPKGWLGVIDKQKFKLLRFHG